MRHVVLALVGSSILMCGCAAGPHTTDGSIVGTGVGALAGAVVGHHSGHAGGGALIGAAAGALAGGLVGNAEDAREERDAAIAQADYERAARHAGAQAMHNSDLIVMTQNGVGDNVIINAVETRGGNFDLSPSAIIQLKNSGVSDAVILAVQATNTTPRYVPGPIGRPYPPAQAPEVVVVPARPPVSVVFGPPRPAWGYHHPYGRFGYRHGPHW